MNNKILVLPGGVVESLDFLMTYPTPDRLVGASCLSVDPAQPHYADWAFVPDLYDPSFARVVAQVVADKSITGIFCPHDILHEKLTLSGFSELLLNKRPVDRAKLRVTTAHNRAATVLELARNLTDSPLPACEPVSSWLHYSDQILGHSSHDKLAALLAALADAPAGDVVEIGSYWGKSASWLGFAVQFYGVGALLCVDPWTNEAALQKESPAFMVEVNRRTVAGDAFDGFVMAMGIFPPGLVNVLPLPSDVAANFFKKSPCRVESAAFGPTSFCQKIALIHIDGNHDYDVVCLDRDLWCPHVRPGGWIVFDDYVWLHGDGPKRAADEYLATHQDSIARAFVCGTALFIQLNVGGHL